MPDALRLALTTLTVVPVRGPRELDRRTAGGAMALAPLVGLLLAVAAGSLVFLVRVLDGSDLVAAALGVAALAALTRGLHLDGLADLVDGLASYRDPEATRAVMRGPEVGPLGVAAVVLVLLVQVAALEACLDEGRGTASLLLAVALGRLAATAGCAGTTAATAEGLGALVAGTVRRGVVLGWGVALAAAFGSYGLVDPDSDASWFVGLLRPVAAVAVALLVSRLLRRHALRRVGGVTGDVLGALVEVATTAALVVLALGD